MRVGVSKAKIEYRENYTFTDDQFEKLRKLVSDETGISLSEHKKDLLYGRLSRRLRALDIDDFGTYCDILHNNPGDEMQNFINAVTTNLTSFFREKHHFEYLAEELIPQTIKDGSIKGLRVWSAGCSTGEEPYSIAMILRENVPEIENSNVQILASDLDSQVVKTAGIGVYDESRIAGLEDGRKRRWFLRGNGENKGKVRVRPELQKMVSFRQLNLMQEWPMNYMFDIVFCRNVVIYFDKETQKKLFDRFANIIKPGGYLFIGHSETLYRVTDRFELIGKTICRKLH